MDHLPALGTAVGDIIKPTLALYDPLLRQNAEKIRSVHMQTYSYGSHERQKLDVYSPPRTILHNGRKPVLIFLYGGGLVAGHKTLQGYADGLCHANIASFFALKYGYMVIVVDYRLVYMHDAKFPSGGEDLAAAIEWISGNAASLGPEPLDLFIMGNSAGGIHTSTFLLHKSCVKTRAKVLNGNEARLRAIVLLSVPFHMEYSNPSRAEINKTYFGDHSKNAPYGLLRSAQEAGKIDFVQAGVRTLILNGDLDPVDEILKPRDDFILEWLSMGGVQGRSSLAIDMMPGHNHISPFLSLGTNSPEDEAWGHQVAAFCDAVRVFKPT